MDYNFGPTYNPSPDIVKMRIDLTDIMREYEWDSKVIDEIMINDNPTVETVFRLIHEKNPIIAHNILKRFIK